MNTLIFDMFGVIALDPEGNLMPYIKSTFPNYTDDDIEELWQEAACGRIDSISFFKRIGFREDIEKLEKEYLDTVEVDEAFYNTAEKLKKKYKMVLLSNDISKWSRYIRNKFGLDRFFDEIVISGDCGFCKPDTKIFEYLLDKINEPASNCCFIDDRARNLEAAEKLGIETILFNRKGADYKGRSVLSFQELLLYL